MHLVSVSKFPPPCARSKKRARAPAKFANVSAYNNGVSPPTLWRQGPGSMRTGPKNRKPSSETINLINLAVEKKNPWVQHKCMQVQKNITRVQKTHKQVPRIFCDPRSKKNQVRSKKHVQVQKKGAQVQKTCIPFNFGNRHLMTILWLSCRVLSP